MPAPCKLAIAEHHSKDRCCRPAAAAAAAGWRSTALRVAAAAAGVHQTRLGLAAAAAGRAAAPTVHA